YAIASDMVPMVQRLADGPAGAGAAANTQATIVMADSRTNTLLVRAANPARMASLREVVQRLDRPGAGGVGGSGIHVVYLRNADAIKLAQVLRAAFPSVGSGSSGGGASVSTGSTSASASATSAANQNMNSGDGSSAQATAPVGASAEPSTGGFIQADPSTNSLVITAPDALYRQLRAVIDQLDGRRAQIYIEAMIVEVNESKLAETGFQWAGATGDRNIVGAGTNLPRPGMPGLFGLIGAGSNAAVAAASGLNVVLAQRRSDGTFTLGALATFLQTKADGNVLSKPNMIALDNEEAKIVVGQNVPFVTGSYTNANSSNSVNPFTTVDRKDVGLTLRVRPQVGEGGTVRMTVFQENSSIDEASRGDANGPTTNKSSIETTVVIDDGDTLVLGGLLKDGYSDGRSQVPLLGDIPFVGNLFKSRSRSRSKTNLMVFLRPVVMRSQDEANAVTVNRYDYMRGRQIAQTPEGKPGEPVPVVPMLDPLRFSRDLHMPSVRQPLDDPNGPVPMVVMPPGSGVVPRLEPQPPATPAPLPTPATKP